MLMNIYGFTRLLSINQIITDISPVERASSQQQYLYHLNQLDLANIYVIKHSEVR